MAVALLLLLITLFSCFIASSFLLLVVSFLCFESFSLWSIAILVVSVAISSVFVTLLVFPVMLVTVFSVISTGLASFLPHFLISD